MKPNVEIKHELKSTENFSQFKYLSYNRKISLTGKKRAALIRSMRKYGNIYPVLVIVMDNVPYILDGQHRFEVCKKFSIPMCYITLSNLDGSEFSKQQVNELLEELNTTSANWSIKTILGKRATMYPDSAYSTIMEYMELFPCLTPTSLGHVLSGQHGSIGDMLAEGIEIKHDISLDVLQAVHDITELIGIKQKEILGYITRREHINDALFKLMNENSVNMQEFSLLLKNEGDDFKMFNPSGVTNAYDHLLEVWESLH